MRTDSAPVCTSACIHLAHSPCFGQCYLPRLCAAGKVCIDLDVENGSSHPFKSIQVGS